MGSVFKFYIVVFCDIYGVFSFHSTIVSVHKIESEIRSVAKSKQGATEAWLLKSFLRMLGVARN